MHLLMSLCESIRRVCNGPVLNHSMACCFFAGFSKVFLYKLSNQEEY